ncbi:MAG: hypothetical protein AAB215_09650 [Planctomycetota bacterium]
MNLKPQDILLVLKLAALEGKPWTQAGLAMDLGFSQGEVSSGLKRARAARLLVKAQGGIRPSREALIDFLLHGLPFVFVPERGALTRGIPTAEAAPVLASRLAPADQPPPVWPDPDGETRGEAFSPLYRSAPRAALRDEKLYALLALVDAVRGGRARARSLAQEELRRRLRAP